MAVVTATVVAGSTATLLYRNPDTTNITMVITSHNNSADVYLGGSTVTSSSNGIVIPKSQTFTFVVPAGETLYCAGNGTDTLKFLCFT